MDEAIRKAATDEATLIDMDTAFASRGHCRSKSSRRLVCHVLG